MTIDTNDMIGSILESLSRIDYVRPDDIPNIDLYMDQVTTFMDDQLSSTKRYADDKILTKTMINNYAKNNLIPPPVKKKYSKEHVLLLIFVYYFKNILSIKDIESLMSPLTNKYFQSEEDFSMATIYSEVCHLEKAQIENLKADIAKSYENADNSFEDAPEEDREYLHLFAFICHLSFEVYVKKALIEKLIDELPMGSPQNEEAKKTKKQSLTKT